MLDAEQALRTYRNTTLISVLFIMHYYLAPIQIRHDILVANGQCLLREERRLSIRMDIVAALSKHVVRQAQDGVHHTLLIAIGNARHRRCDRTDHSLRIGECLQVEFIVSK